MLIVGGGVSAAATYYFLVNKLSSLPLSLPRTVVWEKSSMIGGRMVSWPFYDDGNASTASVRADMGAQYITVQRQPSPYQAVYDTLVARGVLIPLTEPIEGVKKSHYDQKHYIAWKGTSDIVYSLFEGADVISNRELIELNISDSGEEWIAKYSTSSGSFVSSTFKDICLCVTSSSLLQIKGNWLDRIRTISGAEDIFNKLLSTRYSSRFALALRYSPESSELLSRIPWMAKYVDNDDVIRYISIENKKLQTSNKLYGGCILLHSSVPFGVKHRDMDDETIIKLMLDSMNRIIPELSAFTPVDAKLINWKESQVSKTISSDLPLSFLASIPINKYPGKYLRLGMAGDAFTESNFEGCLQSAEDLACSLANSMLKESTS